MPHPSNPLDDIRAGSLYREHGLLRGLEDVWLVSGAAPAKDVLDSGQRAQRLSDGLSYVDCRLLSQCIFDNKDLLCPHFSV